MFLRGTPVKGAECLKKKGNSRRVLGGLRFVEGEPRKMETEIVDDDEFAAIEMAMAQAAQRVQAASVNVPALPPNPPARPQSGNASFTQNSGVQAGPRHTPSNPAPCSGPTGAHGSSDSSSGAPQRAAVPQQTHSQTQSTGRNDPQRRTGTLDCFVVNSSNSNGVNGMAPSQNGMAQRQNGISQNRSPCKPLPQANEQQPSGSSTAWNGNAMVVTFKLLEGGKRFSAQCGYNLRVIETFKSCKDRNYDVPTKTWSFGIGTHQELLQKLQDMGSIPRCMLIVYAIGPKLGYAAAQAEST